MTLGSAARRATSKAANLPAIGDTVHFVAQSGRCCAAIVTDKKPVRESQSNRLAFSVYVLPKGKIPFHATDKLMNNSAQPVDMIHAIWDCKQDSYR